MLIEFSRLPRNSYALAVLGAGPAGIIVALEHARRRPDLRVLLVDYGAPGAPVENALDDSITILNPTNHHGPYECTNKGLGGSTATWGGRCVMYDRGDFVPRAVLGDTCTWDASFLDDCLPHVAAAQTYFESGRGAFDLADAPDRANLKPIAEGFRSTLVSDTVLERWSLPTRFGRRYAAELTACPNLDLLLGVEVGPLGAPDAAGRIAEVELFLVDGGARAQIQATVFVLAAGTQESTRLLLRSPAVFSRLAAVPPALGRYYQGHVSGKIASVCFAGDPGATEFGFRREADGTYQRRRFQFTASALVGRNLLNTAFWLDNPLYFDPGHRNGAMSFMYLAMLMPILGKKLAPPAVAYSITKGAKANRAGAHLWNIIRDFPGSLWTPASIFVRRYCRKRKLPGVFLGSRENRYALHFHAEQLPRPENRMELAADGRTLVVHYQVTDADAEAVIRAHELLDAELQACGCGRLEYWHPAGQRRAAIQAMSKDGVHQSGTTRIGDTPEIGVVDRDLRVWGTANLYVCSSSVFPTSGQANPTFFTGVCAIRLAVHLTSHANG